MAISVDLSELKYQIEIQNQTTVIDENGFPQQLWQTIRKTRARIDGNYNSKLEKEKFDGMTFIPRKEFIIRKLKGIHGTDCRILYKKQAYNIILIEDIDEDGFFIKILGQLEE